MRKQFECQTKEIQEICKSIRLSGMGEYAMEAIDEAKQKQLPYETFLLNLLKVEQDSLLYNVR